MSAVETGFAQSFWCGDSKCEEQIKEAALSSIKVKEFTAGKTIKKIIVVPKKLVNVVAG